MDISAGVQRFLKQISRRNVQWTFSRVLSKLAVILRAPAEMSTCLFGFWVCVKTGCVIEQVNTITNELLLLYSNRLIHGTKTSKKNIIPHNKWVPVCNFMYTKLAEKPMGVAGAGPLPWRQMNFTFFHHVRPI